MLPRKGCKLIFLEKVVDAHPVEVGNQAYMVLVVEGSQEVDTFASTDRISRQEH